MFDRVLKSGVPLLLTLLAACVTPRPPPQPSSETGLAPRQTLEAFLAAEQAHDFERVYGLLSAPLRARYTPQRLERDHQRDRALAEDQLSRIRAALGQGVLPVIQGDRAVLPLGGERAVHLVEEGHDWRIEGLE